MLVLWIQVSPKEEKIFLTLGKHNTCANVESILKEVRNSRPLSQAQQFGNGSAQGHILVLQSVDRFNTDVQTHAAASTGSDALDDQSRSSSPCVGFERWR